MMRLLRRVWITLGIGATIVFVTWSVVAYRAAPSARAALRSDGAVSVSRSEGVIHFVPSGRRAEATGLIFYPGALVDPVAYAPLGHALAAAGHEVVVVTLPKRGAFGGAESPKLLHRTDSILAATGPERRWVVGGHSRGGVVASSVAAARSQRISGLLLVGTSHPRDVDLRGLTIPVTKVVGTRDGLASPAEVRANAHLLPAHTRWLWVEGGNHSQFGWYGFQPGDRRAHLSRPEQRRELVAASLELLREARSSR
jgi:pimeloyl-ACP methyl ester carboxylesterase